MFSSRHRLWLSDNPLLALWLCSENLCCIFSTSQKCLLFVRYCWFAAEHALGEERKNRSLSARSVGTAWRTENCFGHETGRTSGALPIPRIISQPIPGDRVIILAEHPAWPRREHLLAGTAYCLTHWGKECANLSSQQTLLCAGGGNVVPHVSQAP